MLSSHRLWPRLLSFAGAFIAVSWRLEARW